MTTTTPAEKVWAALIERNPGEEPARLASGAYEISEAVAKECAARQEATGERAPEELVEAAMLALVRGKATPIEELARRACDLAQAMAKVHQEKNPF